MRAVSTVTLAPIVSKNAPQLTEEARPMAERTDAEQLGDGLAEVGKRRPHAKIDARPNRLPHDEQRHVLPRMIRARRRGIVAVIGRHDEDVGRLQARQQLVETPVETLEVVGVALNVVPMPVHRVEVDQVREDEATGLRVEGAKHLVHPMLVARRVNRRRDAAPCKQILDFADGQHWNPRGRQLVESRFLERRQREVAAVRGPLVAPGLSDERPCDDPSNAQATRRELEGDLAIAVQLGKRNDVFMGRNLKDAVGRGVDDGLAGPVRARARAVR